MRKAKTSAVKNFLATHAVGFVISNSKYERLRPKTKFEDLK